MRTEESKVIQFDSRHQVLAELQRAGLNTAICDGLSIESLNELMCGVKNILISSQQEKMSYELRKPKKATLSNIDKKIISRMMSSSGKVSSVALSKELGIPFTTLQRHKKKLEKLIETNYSIRLEELGWKKATLFVSISKRELVTIGKEILELNKSIVSVRRIIGSMNGDLAVEMMFRTNNDIVHRIEEIRGVAGVEQVGWFESMGPAIGVNEKYYEEILTSL